MNIKAKRPLHHNLIKVIKDVLNTDVTDSSYKRDLNHADGRNLYCYLLRKQGWKCTEIGKTIGKHYSTVVHNCNTHLTQRDVYPHVLENEKKVLLQWYDMQDDTDERKEIFINIWNSLV